MATKLLPLRDLGDRCTSSLDRERQETDAIREIWKRAKSGHQRFSRVKSSVPYSGVFDGSGNEYEDKGQTGRPLRHSSALDDIRSRIRSRRDKNDSRNSNNSNNVINDKNDNISIRTAITERPSREDRRKPHPFNALNRKLLIRLPNIFDARAATPCYTTSDIGEWRDEVQKRVPERPQLYHVAKAADPEVRCRSAVEPLVRQQKTMNDSSCHFLSTTVPYKGKGKEYMIDPEWTSENFATQRSPRSDRSQRSKRPDRLQRPEKRNKLMGLANSWAC